MKAVRTRLYYLLDATLYFTSCLLHIFSLEYEAIVSKTVQLINQIPEAVFLVKCDPSMNELWAT